jgi:hypothetical protein
MHVCGDDTGKCLASLFGAGNGARERTEVISKVKAGVLGESSSLGSVNISRQAQRPRFRLYLA